jgi:hypothetical protein
MYYLGGARSLDLNAHPAVLGMPSTRQGFYDLVEGNTKCICPLCFQRFTYQNLENEHMQGPCQNFRKKLVDTKKEALYKNKEQMGDGVKNSLIGGV